MVVSKEIPLRTPVVIVDMDGVLVKSISGETMDDPVFWEEFWSDPTAEPNPEMVDLVGTLATCGWHAAILTGRPEKYREPTIEWLCRHLFQHHHDASVSLTMYPGRDVDGHADWKAERILRLANLYDVKVMLEDYPPNAYAAREHVPVLLYEMIKKRRPV